MSFLTAFISGLLFAAGLALSGMTEPSRVLGFLDIAGAWDPTLGFVMAGALAVYAPLFRLIVRKKYPLAATVFELPSVKRIDPPLLAGAALFGIGWGLAGMCPGPAIVVAGAGMREALVFVGAMIAGAFMFVGTQRIRERADRQASGATKLAAHAADA